MHIRFRIDGILQEIYLGALEDDINANQGAVVSRSKILGKLDIAEKRWPQDGSFRAQITKDGHIIRIDFRISIVPGHYGESVVLRVLDPRNAPQSIDQLGFWQPITVNLHQLLQRTTGLLLITGPTGSGKSTTLYAALKTLYRPDITVLTAEDPVEYVYLVLSTLHTNDAIGAIPRLLDLGTEANLITSCLLGVLSQRLVRKVCSSCKGPYLPAADLLNEFFEQPPVGM
jgi:type II secretory ATPase GspE/PulE/Tfp pilus assembly ATPase PilB-like protein